MSTLITILHHHPPLTKSPHPSRSPPLPLLKIVVFGNLYPLDQGPHGDGSSAKLPLQVLDPLPRETRIPSGNLETVCYAPKPWKRTPFLETPDSWSSLKALGGVPKAVS